MSAPEQMEYVELYLQEKIDSWGPLENANDTFMAVFYPAAIGAGPDFSIYDHAARTRSTQYANSIRRQNYGITTSGEYTAMAFRNSRVDN